MPLRSQQLETRSWHYYSLTVNSGSGLRVSLNQTSDKGDADLYIEKGTLPTRSHSLVKEVSGTTRFTLDVPPALFSNGVWYFGVYAFSRVTYE